MQSLCVLCFKVCRLRNNAWLLCFKPALNLLCFEAVLHLGASLVSMYSRMLLHCHHNHMTNVHARYVADSGHIYQPPSTGWQNLAVKILHNIYAQIVNTTTGIYAVLPYLAIACNQL